jgi:hypothetical protein
MVSVEGSPVTSAMVDVDILHISFTENMSGTNTIVITATDPSGDSAADTILVTVNAVNDPPLIVDAISFQTYEDDSLDISIYDFVIRDEDTWDEDAFSITISDNENYELSPTEEGYRAVPLPNFFGDIPMAVTASDGEAVSDTLISASGFTISGISLTGITLKTVKNVSLTASPSDAVTAIGISPKKLGSGTAL